MTPHVRMSLTLELLPVETEAGSPCTEISVPVPPKLIRQQRSVFRPGPQSAER